MLLKKILSPRVTMTTAKTGSPIIGLNTSLSVSMPNRINATRDSILNSADLSTQVRDDAIAALNTSESYLDDAQESLDNSNPDEAVSDIEEAKKWEDEANNAIASVTAGTNSSDSTNDSLTSTG